MIRYRALQNQRTRQALSQAAMKRSHRRCDLIRITPDQPAVAPALSATGAEEGAQDSPRTTAPSLA